MNWASFTVIKKRIRPKKEEATSVDVYDTFESEEGRCEEKTDSG